MKIIPSLLLTLLLSATAASAEIEEGLQLLRYRYDRQAMAIFESELSRRSDDPLALWGKAEVFRRQYRYKDSEGLLSAVLKQKPAYAPALISLAYIRYKDDLLDEALKLVHLALESKPDRETRALGYLLLGALQSRRANQGWLLAKIIYGSQVKAWFLKAKKIAPGLAEVHLALGSYYLLAPAIAGGNLGQALKELHTALEIAPEFATANARLAQAYQRKGLKEKYDFYLQRARELDPLNEVIKEITG